MIKMWDSSIIVTYDSQRLTYHDNRQLLTTENRVSTYSTEFKLYADKNRYKFHKNIWLSHNSKALWKSTI